MLSIITASSVAFSVVPTRPTPTIDALSVNLLPGEQKELSSASASIAASILQEHGVVLLRRALPAEVVGACAEAVTGSFDKCGAALKAKKLKPTDPFAFAEIAHRSKLRYDMQLTASATALPDSICSKPPWKPVLQKLLGDDYIDLFQGAVIAEPGAVDQQPHMDGSHLYQATHGYEQLQNPAHCLNVFVPLVNVTEENGPTEFWPGSHVLSRARDALQPGAPSVRLAGAVGDAIIFDYRVVHRGRGNSASERRPVLYLTSSRSWFRDAANFPDEKLLPPGKSGGGGMGGGFGGASSGGGAKGKGKGKRR